MKSIIDPSTKTEDTNQEPANNPAQQVNVVTTNDSGIHGEWFDETECSEG